MPSDSAEKARLVLDRKLVERVQAEARRRGLRPKSPSRLAAMILRDWLEDERPGGGGPSLSERVAALEAKLAEPDAPEAPPAEDRAQAAELPPDEAGRRPLRGKKARKVIASLGKKFPPPWRPDGLRARMAALGYSARSLADVLKVGEPQVVRWLDGLEQPGHRRQLSKLLGS